MRSPLLLALLLALAPYLGHAAPNILFITVDDMSADSIGAFGCKLPDTSPNIDQLAAESLRFRHGHVVVGNCMPSRNVMLSGRYPHNNGVEGFYQVKDPGWPHLCDLVQGAGYFAGIRGKVSHSTPYIPYAWDAVLDEVEGEKMHMKDPESYYKSTRAGIEASAAAGKPFFLLINVSDPHKPFYSQVKGGQDPHVPSRIFTAEEVPVPGFLPDDPVVKEELALYYSSVRRADDCVGKILQALEESGKKEETFVMFLSDHGMPLPFAKTQLYFHSTHTPWMVRWPGVTKPGAIDEEHMISAVDITPTLLDVAGIPHPDGFDGRSFEPILRGEHQEGRDYVYKVYNENSGGNRHPMRSVQNKRFAYIFNPFSDGERVFKTATQGTMTYRRMKELAQTDDNVAARLELFDHRVVEEFYDYEKDPDALVNLIGNPEYQEQVKELRAALENQMQETKDHALDPLLNRDNPEALAAYMEKVQAESDARRANKRGSKAPKQKGLIKLKEPSEFKPGAEVSLEIRHNLPEALGKQLVHVTLKEGQKGKRLDRKVEAIEGKGTLIVTFQVPEKVEDNVIRFSAFVGEDFPQNLEHLDTKTVPASQ